MDIHRSSGLHFSTFGLFICIRNRSKNVKGLAPDKFRRKQSNLIRILVFIGKFNTAIRMIERKKLQKIVIKTNGIVSK